MISKRCGHVGPWLVGDVPGGEGSLKKQTEKGRKTEHGRSSQRQCRGGKVSSVREHLPGLGKLCCGW